MSDYTPPTLVTPTPGGNPGDGTLKGALIISPNPNSAISHGGSAEIYTDNNGNLFLSGGKGQWVFLGGGINGDQGLYLGGSVTMKAAIVQFNSINTVGLGVAPIYGKDVRTGLTAADASATTLYTTTAAGQVYEVAARIFGTGGTITSGVYTIGWTEGGVARTATVSITATGTLSSSLFLLQPDSGTAITGQLTTLSGTSPVVNVAAVVKEDV